MHYFYEVTYEKPIWLDEICPHSQRLCFEATKGEEEGEDDFYFYFCHGWVEWYSQTTQKNSLKMKQCIKEVISQLAFPKTTILTPPPKKIQTKGATKKVRSTPNEASTSRKPSL